VTAVTQLWLPFRLGISLAISQSKNAARFNLNLRINLRDMREEVDGKISDLSDSLSDLVYQKEALQEEIDAHFTGFNINFKGQK
jgi:predicted  nucleic acid-binding Zn-ribbon protein